MATVSKNLYDRIKDLSIKDFDEISKSYTNTYFGTSEPTSRREEPFSFDPIDYIDLPESESRKEEFYKWEEEYNAITKSNKKTGFRPTSKKRVEFVPKKSYIMKECLKAYRDLQEKDLGNICLTGSLALKLQGIITRSQFSDMDITVVGAYQLDDDINFYYNPKQYPKNNLIDSDTKQIVYDNIPIDLFVLPEDSKVNTVEVNYQGETYLCQDFRDILKVKLNMILPNMKDYQELIDNHIVIDFK